MPTLNLPHKTKETTISSRAERYNEKAQKEARKVILDEMLGPMENDNSMLKPKVSPKKLDWKSKYEELEEKYKKTLEEKNILRHRLMLCQKQLNRFQRVLLIRNNNSKIRKISKKTVS